MGYNVYWSNQTRLELSASFLAEMIYLASMPIITKLPVLLSFYLAILICVFFASGVQKNNYYRVTWGPAVLALLALPGKASNYLAFYLAELSPNITF